MELTVLQRELSIYVRVLEKSTEYMNELVQKERSR
jgi:hypothetical protein